MIMAEVAIKLEGKSNDLIERIIEDPEFKMSEEEILSILAPENFVGRSPEQVEEFVRDFIQPILKNNQDILGKKAQLSV